MTKKRVLAGLVVLLFAGWVYAAPYLAVHGMKKAVDNGDSAALADYVDFPALKASLKSGLSAQMTKQVAKKKDYPLTALGTSMANALVNPLIDGLVSPEGLAALMKGQQRHLGKAGGEGGTQGELAGPNLHESNVDMGYESLNRFTVTASGKGKSEQKLTLVFLRDGLSWKLSAIRLPDL